MAGRYVLGMWGRWGGVKLLGKKMGILDMIIVVGVALLVLRACGNDGTGSKSPSNPNPGVTVCNQYYKGGC
jgi:hypothetical protein